MQPVVIVLVTNDADSFRWMSDGWYAEAKRHLPEAQRLYKLADDCMEEGADVPDVVRRLEAAGFAVRRATGEEQRMAAALPPWK